MNNKWDCRDGRTVRDIGHSKQLLENYVAWNVMRDIDNHWRVNDGIETGTVKRIILRPMADISLDK